MAHHKQYNCEKTEWYGRSYKKGGKIVRYLREINEIEDIKIEYKLIARVPRARVNLN